MRRPFLLVALAATAWLWVIAIVAAPIIPSAATTTGSRLAAMIYVAGSFICHQRPERSFHLADAQLAVCARCTGLYVGGALGVIAWALMRGVGRSPSLRAMRFGSSTLPRTVLLSAGAPTAISVVTGLSGLWSPDNAVRAALAVPLGCAIGAVVGAVLTRDLR